MRKGPGLIRLPAKGPGPRRGDVTGERSTEATIEGLRINFEDHADDPPPKVQPRKMEHRTLSEVPWSGPTYFKKVVVLSGDPPAKDSTAPHVTKTAQIEPRIHDHRVSPGTRLRR